MADPRLGAPWRPKWCIGHHARRSRTLRVLRCACALLCSVRCAALPSVTGAALRFPVLCHKCFALPCATLSCLCDLSPGCAVLCPAGLCPDVLCSDVLPVSLCCLLFPPTVALLFSKKIKCARLPNSDLESEFEMKSTHLEWS